MLTIKRTRPGMNPYWVLPGGHVCESDASLEEALARELYEELAADISSPRLVHVLEHEAERQYFYLARAGRWSFADKTGPEFSEPGRGSYVLEEIPLIARAITAVNLKPDEIAAFLTAALRKHGGLAALPRHAVSPEAGDHQAHDRQLRGYSVSSPPDPPGRAGGSLSGSSARRGGGISAPRPTRSAAMP